ncbi:MAG: TolC family protein [Deltaproteobacteria bacterium]|nr:TolC family protein [Deltaproteobacteria bacterium]
MFLQSTYVKNAIFFLLLFILSSKAISKEYTLNELITIALKNNKEIMSLREDKEYYRGKYIEASAAYYLPYVNADIMAGGPVANHKKEVNRVTDASNFGYMGIDNAGYLIRSNVEFLYPIYTFGKLGSIRDAASLGVESAEANIKAKELEIAIQIAQAYYGIILYSNILSVLKDGERRLKEARDKLKELLEKEEGNVTEKDLYKLDYYSSELYFKIAETKKGLEITKSSLKTICGIQDDIETSENSLEMEQSSEINLAEYIAKSKENRNEVKAIRNLKKSLELLAKAQKRAYLPDIFIGGGLKFSHSNFDFDETNPWIRDDFNYFGFAIGLGARINLEIGIKYGREIQSYAQFMKYQYLEEALLNAVELQTRKLYEEYLEAKNNFETYSRGEKAAKKWLTTETMNYNIGLGDTKGLIDSLVAYAQSGIIKNKSLYDMKIKKLILDYYSGRIKIPK